MKNACHALFYFLIIATFTGLPGCNQPTDSGSGTREVSMRDSIPDLTKITDQNVRQVLTDFGKHNPETQVLISTPMGDIKIRLYEETPLHRANFILMAKSKFLDEGVFYRVVKDFMIQGGDSDDRTMKLSKYRVPAEIQTEFIHKKGALAMARYSGIENPQKASSSHDFYLVQGLKRTEPELQAYAEETGMIYTPEQVKIYETIGGAPNLDNEYTVFGEVVEGLEVIDKIAAVEVDKQMWPKKDVPMKVTVLE
jgi:cyclophilin family peptidyl-prolyl cis-trans isomerase